MHAFINSHTCMTACVRVCMDSTPHTRTHTVWRIRTATQRVHARLVHAHTHTYLLTCMNACVHACVSTPASDPRTQLAMLGTIGRPINGWHCDEPNPRAHVICDCVVGCNRSIWHHTIATSRAHTIDRGACLAQPQRTFAYANWLDVAKH